MYDLDRMYNDIEKLRKNIDREKYDELQQKNKADKMYGWAFEYGNVLYETKEQLIEKYMQYYVKDIFNVYLEILQNCQKEKVV